MTTLTIEFPDELAEHIQNHSISKEHLKTTILHFIKLYISEYGTSDSKNQPWSSGTEFANRMIANNRKLFEELAQL